MTTWWGPLHPGSFLVFSIEALSEGKDTACQGCIMTLMGAKPPTGSLMKYMSMNVASWISSWTNTIYEQLPLSLCDINTYIAYNYIVCTLKSNTVETNVWYPFFYFPETSILLRLNHSDSYTLMLLVSSTAQCDESAGWNCMIGKMTLVALPSF